MNFDCSLSQESSHFSFACLHWRSSVGKPRHHRPGAINLRSYAFICGSVFVNALDSKDSDRIDRINTAANPVQTVASISAAPDSRKILEFISARLSAAPEEGDVVHDLLAYLAERMIDMNKEKNAEIKGFLHWFEGEIGAPIDEFTNKTTIKEYYEAGFDVLTGGLAKNKKKLKDKNISGGKDAKETEIAG